MSVILKLGGVLKEAGISYEELSCELGWTENQLKNVKTGRCKSVRFTTLDTICEITGCDLDELIERVQE